MADRAKPERCTHPDCFSCPYEDCMWDQIAIDEYKQSVNLDKENRQLKEYEQRSFDCTGRKEYFRNYYQKNREKHLARTRLYKRRTHYKETADRREYFKQYYREHRDEIIAKRNERKEAINATR